MHPEVKSDKAGKCPNCGMALVAGSWPKVSEDRGLGPITWRSYLPLATIVALILVTVIASSGGVAAFMAGFFLVFAGFKLIDLNGFAEGYATYDLIAARVPVYGYFYPFLELSFGLAMIALGVFMFLI